MEFFSALPPLPAEVRELLLLALPFIVIAFVAAAVMFLTRDVLGKPKKNGNGNGNGRRNGNGNGHGYRNGNENGNGNGHYRNANGNGNGNGNGGKKEAGGNGNGNGYGVGGDLAIPTLAQPASLDAAGLGNRMENWFSRLLYECGAPFTRDVAFMTELAGGLLVGGLLLLWLENIVVAALGFIVGMGLVILMYVLARGRRRRIMREQLPDIIDHMARAMRAGQTIDQALHLVGEASPQPLGVEFRRCSGQINMGLSVDAAMQALSRRVPIPEMRIMASTFIVQRRAGGSLPLTLERLAKVTRDRISYYRQFRAATSGSRMSMLIVALAGPLVGIYMMIFRPEMFELFFQSGTGWFLFFLAIGLYVIALTWIFFILKTDY